jgi:serine/threonine protein kinase
LSTGTSPPDRDAPTVAPRALAAAPAATASAPAPEPDPLVGSIVASRFRIAHRIGEGGMGAVYLAEHVALGKKVAIKILHAEMHSNPEVRARFKREAMAMAQLEHENIVAATDFGQLEDGAFFLAMEFIEGQSLRDLLAKSGRLAVLRALKILRQIASALTRAHSLSIVHRDLKPENILIVHRPGSEEVVKIIDFGIARFTSGDGERPLTQTGVIFGTPHYMAPEQALGRRVDAAADQYAFGVLAFELLTGRKPFDHENLLELLDLHVNGAIPRATSVATDLPAAIDAVFDRLLAKSPIERFSSVADAMDAIDETLAPALASPAQFGFVATQPATGASYTQTSHDKTMLASQAALEPPTVSNTAPTIQDQLQASAPAPVVPSSSAPQLLGLPIVRLGRFGDVPVAVIIIVSLTSVLMIGASIASAPSRPRRRSTQSAAVSERIAAVRAQSDVRSALALAAHGDVQAAIASIRAKRAANPSSEDDAILAMQLGMLLASDRQALAAVGAFADATSRDPSLVEDDSLVRTMLRLLDDPSAQSSAETLLRAGSFARSRAAARLLAEETVYGRTQEARRRAGRLARERLALLEPVSRARVVLRTSDRCDELQSVMAQSAALSQTPAGEDIQRLRAGHCAMLSRRQLCQCVSDRN